jgi:hypothetical protein
VFPECSLNGCRANRLLRNRLLQDDCDDIRDCEALAKDLQEIFEPNRGITDLFALNEVVFVFTDIQGSTAMSAVDPVAMKCAQHHDNHNYKHAYASARDSLTHLRVLLVLTDRGILKTLRSTFPECALNVP